MDRTPKPTPQKDPRELVTQFLSNRRCGNCGRQMWARFANEQVYVAECRCQCSPLVGSMRNNLGKAFIMMDEIISMGERDGERYKIYMDDK